MKNLLAFVGALFILPSVYALNGWALKTLWLWFIVPVFHLPLLLTPQAIGISLVVGYLTKSIPKEGEKASSFTYIILMAVAKSLIALAFGWIVLRFM